MSGDGLRPADSGKLYADPRHYDARFAHLTEDIAFYTRMALESGGPVLELACGSGRITLPLAAAGADVTGLDSSVAMLEHARRKAEERGLEPVLLRGDMRDFSLGRKFSLVFIPFTSIGHLHTGEEFEMCLGRVREHLAPGGLFVVDFFNPDPHILARDAGERHPAMEYDDPDGGGKVIITESTSYDRAAQLNHVRYYVRREDSEVEEVIDFCVRIWFPLELEEMLHYNGFKVRARYGDHGGNPFGPGSKRLILVCSG